MDYEKMNPWNYLKTPDGVVQRFPFNKRDERKNREVVAAAFREHGMEVADISWELTFMTWVLTTKGDLYLYDTSNGGGSGFVLESKAK